MKRNWNDPGRGYREAAAVLSCFDPETLQPYGPAGAREPAISYLLADSTFFHDAQNRPRWMLRHDVRRAVLQRLGERSALQAALAANPQRPDDELQRALEGYIHGAAPAPAAQQPAVEPAQLAAAVQVATWLEGVLDNVPASHTLERQLLWSRLLEPFHYLVGQHFRGRQETLTWLDERMALRPENDAAAPVLLYGPGGVGKSTVLAKFILDRVANVPEPARLPFTYIDFDRPGLLAEQPLTLLVEAMRQLAVQFSPAASVCEELRQEWLNQIARTEEDVRQFGYQKSVYDSRVRTDLLGQLDYGQQFAWLVQEVIKAADRPFLFVLDTFEEVQYRSRDFIYELWQFVRRLQHYLPSLRVIFSGRAPIEEFETQEHRLGALDTEAAVGFLEFHGQVDEELAREIVARVGGNPLSLSLAAQVVREEGLRGLQDLESRPDIWHHLEESQIQGMLYERILKHIHDKDARQLAHPGLVLRRITPELIEQVLAEPCGVKLDRPADAHFLFSELAREASLVRLDESGALRHRTDVRRVMLEALKTDAPLKVRQIHEGAVAYYQRRQLDSGTDPADRAEELYHRLFLADDFTEIAERWMPGVEPFLASALDEIPRRFRPELASLLGVEGYYVDWKGASSEAWERRTIQRAADMVARGRYERALEALYERDGDSYRTGSPLYLLEAQALVQLDRWQEARSVARKGIYSVARTDDHALLFDLLVLAARIDERLGYYRQGREMLDAARPLAKQRDDPLKLLEISIQQLRLLRLEQAEDERIEAMRRDVLALLDSLSESTLTSYPRLLRDLAQELTGQEHRTLSRIIEIVGLGDPSPEMRQALYEALRLWLAALSNADSAEIGKLLHRFSDHRLPDLVHFLAEARPGTLTAFCQALTAGFAIDENVTEALNNMLESAEARQAFAA